MRVYEGDLMGFLTKAAQNGFLGGGVGAYATNKGFRKNVNEFAVGAPEQNYQQSLLGPEQQGLYGQMQQSLQGAGAGGAFGDSSDYYRDLLSDDSQTANAMFAPEMRRFNEQIVPGLAEQFAGMGSGGLSSSSFRNASINAGTDLSERLGAIRAGLRQQGAQGLQQAGQFGLGQFNENIHRPATEGFAQKFATGLGQGVGKMAAGGF